MSYWLLKSPCHDHQKDPTPTHQAILEARYGESFRLKCEAPDFSEASYNAYIGRSTAVFGSHRHSNRPAALSLATGLDRTGGGHAHCWPHLFCGHAWARQLSYHDRSSPHLD